MPGDRHPPGQPPAPEPVEERPPVPSQSPIPDLPSPPIGQIVPAREIELKLHVEPGALARLIADPDLPGLDRRPPRSKHLHTVYFDTPERHLFDAGLSLRVRRRDGQFFQAVKTLNRAAQTDDAAVARRRGWRWRIESDQPDLGLLATAGIARMVPTASLQHLKPVFETDVERTSLWIGPDSLTSIEVALDRGEIRADGVRVPVSEIALGLYAGTVGRLFELALALQQRVPLRIAEESKADVGYGLITGRIHQACPVLPLALSPATSLAEGIRAILRHSLRLLLCNEPCALAVLEAGTAASGDSAESPPGDGGLGDGGLGDGGLGDRGEGAGLRLMGVALQRLVIALRLFGDTIESAEALALRKDLRRIASVLAPATDWAILSGLVVECFPDQPAHRHALGEIILGGRRVAYEAARQALLAPGYTSTLLALGGWIEDGHWQRDASPETRAVLDRPIGDLAAAWLERRWRKTLKAGLAGAGQPTGKAALRLGRRVRRLRVLAEFFRGLYPPTATRPFAAAVDALETSLEGLEDLATAAVLADQFNSGAAAEILALFLTRRRAHLATALADHWQEFTAAPPFWR
ncbi:MAG: CHAD domain-containing protein [Azospirillum sp.]|nr:CHAD domain-containing protein [Azospirillum sp.]